MAEQLPPDFLNSLQGLKGFNAEAFSEVHASGDQVTSIRLNPFKDFQLQEGKDVHRVPWSTRGFYLKDRPSFTLDPAFHSGAYYVQEASSMFLEVAMTQACDLTQPLRVLDLCAAPGGKSTLIQSLISKDSILISNEIAKNRVNILSENISKWGGANVVVTNNEPDHFSRLAVFFDVIVVDAPCSGSGLFRKDPKAIDEWSPDIVEMCSLRQQRILKSVLPSLKPGGILIYSTCSYSIAEDEHICDTIIQEHGMHSFQLQLQDNWHIVETQSENEKAFGYRFYPDKLMGEGFFIAVFKNGEEEDLQEERSGKNKLQLCSKNEADVISRFVDSSNAFSFIKLKEEILILPPSIFSLLGKLQSALYIKQAGIKAGTVIRDELVPAHELAVSTILSTTVASKTVDLTTALEYLRKRDVIFEANHKGWMVIKYNNLSLGWVKHVGSRINNYYPKEWRILNK